MKQDTYLIFHPALQVVVIMFLFTIFISNTNYSFAASDKNTSSGVARISGAEHAEAQIKALQNELMITDSQKELWNDLTRVMRQNAKEMDVLEKERAQNNKVLTAVERMRLYSEITEVHLNQLNRFIPPFEAFYSILTDEQKKITDKLFYAEK